MTTMPSVSCPEARPGSLVLLRICTEYQDDLSSVPNGLVVLPGWALLPRIPVGSCGEALLADIHCENKLTVSQFDRRKSMAACAPLSATYKACCPARVCPAVARPSRTTTTVRAPSARSEVSATSAITSAAPCSRLRLTES